MSKLPATWFSAQLAGFVQSVFAWGWIIHQSVGSPASGVLSRKSWCVTAVAHLMNHR